MNALFMMSNSSMLNKKIIEAHDSVNKASEINKIRQEEWKNTAVVCITWDMLHVWHVDYIQTIKSKLYRLFWETKLMVWVENDYTSSIRKGKTPIYSQQERQAIFNALKPVDHAFISWSHQTKEEKEVRPYQSTIDIWPNILVSHEEYYPDEKSIKETVEKAMDNNIVFMLIGYDEWLNLRKKFNRSTSSTIEQIIQQHWHKYFNK